MPRPHSKVSGSSRGGICDFLPPNSGNWFPALLNSQAPSIAGLLAGALMLRPQASLSGQGGPLSSWRVPRLCSPPPAPHSQTSAHYQMGGAGTPGWWSFRPGRKKNKELCRGRGRGWPRGWQEWRGRFTMEYEVKKGKKVGGRSGGMQGEKCPQTWGRGKPGVGVMSSKWHK